MNPFLPRKKRTRTGVSIPDDLLAHTKRYPDLNHGGNVSKLIAETLEQGLEGVLPTLPDSGNDRVIEELARSLGDSPLQPPCSGARRRRIAARPPAWRPVLILGALTL